MTWCVQVHGCVGASSLLLYGASRVIFELNWQENVVSWFDTPDLAANLGLQRDELIDLYSPR